MVCDVCLRWFVIPETLRHVCLWCCHLQEMMRSLGAAFWRELFRSRTSTTSPWLGPGQWAASKIKDATLAAVARLPTSSAAPTQRILRDDSSAHNTMMCVTQTACPPTYWYQSFMISNNIREREWEMLKEKRTTMKTTAQSRLVNSPQCSGFGSHLGHCSFSACGFCLQG